MNGNRHGKTRHFFFCCGITLLQTVLFLITCLPILFIVNGTPFILLEDESAWIGWLIVMLVFLFLIAYPFRLWSNSFLCSTSARTGNASVRYTVFAAASARRIAAGLPAGLPFLFSATLLIYGFKGMDAPAFFEIIAKLAQFIGNKGIDEAILVWVIFIALTGCLFMAIWWLGVNCDHIPLGNGVRRGFLRASLIRNRSLRDFLKTGAVNFLLALPAVLVSAAFFAHDLLSDLDLSAGYFSLTMQLIGASEQPLSNAAALVMTAAGLLIYIPLKTVRNKRNAAFTEKHYRALFKQGHS